MRRIRIVLLCTAVALVASGCGSFGSTASDKGGTTTLLGEGDEIGSGFTTAATAPRTTTTTTAPPTTEPPCPYTDRVSEIEYDGRLRLTLTISHLCPNKVDDIGLSLRVTNLSDDPIHYDKNQAHLFSLLPHPPGSGRIRWEDTNCQPPSGARNEPAGVFPAGATLTFNGLYPAPESVGDREKCRRLEVGSYTANAVFLVCEGAAYTDGYCDISKDTQYKATPVLIDVRA